MPTFMQKHGAIRENLLEVGLDRHHFEDMFDHVIAIYEEWAAVLPDMTLWKTRKPEHARTCRKLVEEFAPTLGFNAIECAYFGMLFAAHDLGRMVQAVLNSEQTLDAEFVDRWRFVLTVQRPNPYPDSYHGQDSALLLKGVLDDVGKTQIGRWSLDAVRMHSFVENPTLQQAGSNPDLLALANVLRDIDKVEGFRAAKQYTADDAFKAKQRLQNWPDQIKETPTWGVEHGCINPSTFLDLFVQEQAINRKQCQSYEAYMLQYLAWMFCIVQPEMVDVALAEGGPQIVARYLIRQLQYDPVQSAKLHMKLQSWRGGVLLR